MPRRPAFLFGSVDEQLMAVPIKNARVARTPGEEPGTVILEVELTYGKWKWLSRWLKARRRKSIAIDGLALEVYDRIDGVRTLGHLVAWFMEDHALTFFEARGLTINYLHLLTERGLIAILGRK